MTSSSQRVRILFQHESARTMARAIAPTIVLQGRHYAVFAQAQQTLDTTTNYDITLLSDWSPLAPPPPHLGLVIWDVPEDIMDHINEPLYQQYFTTIPIIATANEKLRIALIDVARYHNVIVLPTYSPIEQLLKKQMNRVPFSIGIFGPTDISLYIDALVAYLREKDAFIMTDNMEVATSLHAMQEQGEQLDIRLIDSSFQSYQKALHTVERVICTQSTMQLHDCFRARDALFCNLPVLINPENPIGVVDHPYIITVRKNEWAKTLATSFGHLSLQQRMPHDKEMREKWSLNHNIEQWTKQWAKLGGILATNAR